MEEGEGVKDFIAVGDIVNVAARLPAKAQAGEIVACERTLEKGRDLIPGHYVVEKVSLDLKGKEDPYPAYILRPGA